MTDEKKIIAEAQQGKESAFAQLVELHQKKVYNLAYRMTGNHEDAMDVSQEAFLKAWKALPNFKGDSSFSTWMYRLTTNAAIDFLRKQKPKDSLTSTYEADEEGTELQIPDTSISPETALMHKELGEFIQEGMSKLPSHQKEVLILREMEGLSYQEISSTLAVDLGTVKSRIARARTTLRSFLLKKDMSPDQKRKDK